MPQTSGSQVRPTAWRHGVLRLRRQTLLPAEERYVEASGWRDLAAAIRRLTASWAAAPRAEAAAR